MRRVILILTDGLRPDAIPHGRMPSLDALGRDFVRAANARTVRPSATVAALASLATGVSPGNHGLVEPGLRFLTQIGRLRPLARELRRAGYPVVAVAGEIPAAVRPVTATLAAATGLDTFLTAGSTARATAFAAAGRLAARRDGLTFVYLGDCDRAGHAHGWMSDRYLRAAAEIDQAIALLVARAADALVIVVADHGGGGVTPCDHDQPHPVNDAIPLILAGPAVRRKRVLAEPVSLLDVPATILWWLGVPVPPCYEGRPLAEAFVVRDPAMEPVA